jgi:hypothetical protein
MQMSEIMLPFRDEMLTRLREQFEESEGGHLDKTLFQLLVRYAGARRKAQGVALLIVMAINEYGKNHTAEPLSEFMGMALLEGCITVLVEHDLDRVEVRKIALKMRG